MPDMSRCSAGGFILAAIVCALMLAWALREAIGGIRSSKRYLSVRRTFYRSLAPTLAAALILVGITCGAILFRAEAAAASHVASEGSLDVRREVDCSPWSLLRERLRIEHETMMRERRALVEFSGHHVGSVR